MGDVLIFTILSGILFVLCEGGSPEKNHKIKKVESLGTAFFIKDCLVIAELALVVLKHSNRLHKADWLG